MLSNSRGVDIIRTLGEIDNINDAKNFFAEKLDDTQLSRINDIKNTDVLLKIANSISLCNPKRIYINTGSNKDFSFIRKLSISKLEEIKFSESNHTIHYDLKEEQGRIVDRTFYIVNKGEKINSLAKSVDRFEALNQIKKNMTNIMFGGIMIIGFYMRGPIGSFGSNPAIEITSSAYVSHSANILYRNAFENFDEEVNKLGHFYINIHSEGLNRKEDLSNARVFMDRSYRTTYSFNCTYAGNTLLLKKGNHRFSVDKAVYESNGTELAEHMFITGVKGPGDRVTWIAGAAPSGCGKTTTAMAGDYFIGDDLAQMWIKDGSVRSVNPECGIFGIVEDVNMDGDPMLMEVLRNPETEVIWSNVLIDLDGKPQWVGNKENKNSLRGYNYNGIWVDGLKNKSGEKIPMSHPNARCTVSSSYFNKTSEKVDDPNGVNIRIVTYSGRDSDTMPPLWVAKNSDHGVVIGACIVSAATATEVGAKGIKRAPWANAPFIPGSIGDYMELQFNFFGNDKINKKKMPIIAGLNYFLTYKARGNSENGLLGEKKDVIVWLNWLERYSHNDVSYLISPIGFLPKYEDLKILFEKKINKKYNLKIYNRQFSIYVNNILDRIKLQRKSYSNEDNIPNKFFDILDEQEASLLELKGLFGSIVLPDKLQEK